MQHLFSADGGLTPYLRPDRSITLAVGSMIGLDPPRRGQAATFSSIIIFSERWLEWSRAWLHLQKASPRKWSKGWWRSHCEFALRLSSQCVADVLGIHRERVEEYREWSDRDLLHHTPEDQLQVMVEFARFTADIIEERRQSAGDDPISLMIGAEAEGRIDNDELMATTALLIVPGADETSRLLGKQCHSVLA